MLLFPSSIHLGVNYILSILLFHQTQRDVAAILTPYFAADGLIEKCLDYAVQVDHIMDFTRLRSLGALFSMLNQMVRNILAYNNAHTDFPMQVSTMRGMELLKGRCDLGADIQIPNVFFQQNIFCWKKCFVFESNFTKVYSRESSWLKSIWWLSARLQLTPLHSQWAKLRL